MDLVAVYRTTTPPAAAPARPAPPAQPARRLCRRPRRLPRRAAGRSRRTRPPAPAAPAAHLRPRRQRRPRRRSRPPWRTRARRRTTRRPRLSHPAGRPCRGGGEAGGGAGPVAAQLRGEPGAALAQATCAPPRASTAGGRAPEALRGGRAGRGRRGRYGHAQPLRAQEGLEAQQISRSLSWGKRQPKAGAAAQDGAGAAGGVGRMESMEPGEMARMASIARGSVSDGLTPRGSPSKRGGPGDMDPDGGAPAATPRGTSRAIELDGGEVPATAHTPSLHPRRNTLAALQTLAHAGTPLQLRALPSRSRARLRSSTRATTRMCARGRSSAPASATTSRSRRPARPTARSRSTSLTAATSSSTARPRAWAICSTRSRRG